jgi:hypothetical protein
MVKLLPDKLSSLRLKGFSFKICSEFHSVMINLAYYPSFCAKLYFCCKWSYLVGSGYMMYM